jgi:hypothetical protein
MLGVKNELLHAPVQELGDVEHVSRWTGHLVDPAELLQQNRCPPFMSDNSPLDCAVARAR